MRSAMPIPLRGLSRRSGNIAQLFAGFSEWSISDQPLPSRTRMLVAVDMDTEELRPGVPPSSECPAPAEPT
jgi:hypothetical protein